ncbi:hypothetical protein BLOT_000284 [Blomia tropicalis]|nr:hypothetical protein BLOT_000284 [Blomia tropicalis]
MAEQWSPCRHRLEIELIGSRVRTYRTAINNKLSWLSTALCLIITNIEDYCYRCNYGPLILTVDLMKDFGAQTTKAACQISIEYMTR